MSGFEREKPLTRSRQPGFTLVELMVVAAVLGILATIALPKFGNMIIKAKEAAVRGKVGALRSAMSIYYADNEGQTLNGLSWHIQAPPNRYPIFLSMLTPKYLDNVPKISLPYKEFNNQFFGGVGHMDIESDGCLNGKSTGNLGWMAIHGTNLGPPLNINWFGGYRYFVGSNGISVHVNADWPDSTGRNWSTW